MSPILKFTANLSLSLVGLFIIHITILHFLNLHLFGNKIILAYMVNYIMAITIYAGLLYLKTKYSDQLGFLYMAGSFLKFIVFFILFNPSYKLDGKIETSEFFTFFTPYIICLFYETIGVIKFLKK